MRKFRDVCLCCSWLVCVSACSDGGASEPADAAAPGQSPIDALARDGGAGTQSLLDGAVLDGGAAVPRGIAVVHSDYQSSSVSLLDRDGNLVKDGCFNSGTGGPGLSMTLTGDVALPSQIASGSTVPIVDRGNATLTWLDAATCAPLRQMSVGTGFAANPHDYVELAPDKAYVPRYQPNGSATPAANDFDDGNDLLIIDPGKGTIVGRIDLVPFAPAGVLPRADRALLIDGKVYVSLNAADAKFSKYSIGRIVMVDPSTDQVVASIDIPGAKNCGAMTYLAGEKKLLVACGGDYGAGAAQAASSAIVTLDMSVSPPVVTATLTAASLGAQPFSNSTVAALDGVTSLAVATGDFSNVPPDALWLLGPGGVPSSKAFQSSEAFSLGAVLVDTERGRVFVTDGTTQTPASVRVFASAAGTLQQVAEVKTNPTQKLPPRGLAWF